ncbi:MAG: haloacid dehalogenase [Opitutae bacterium]|jgi:phosphoglycolate phosphatase-like HAD superfamily hydrolase|nr:haloacid dehalogenase [Opitutae bacterium]|tara:strand:+ start:2156 stop:2824 length:669 start_codon:yes stop_codon:yes gene_type:complete
MNPKIVFFDLDGTLIDQFKPIYRSYLHALERLGLEPVDYETVKRTVGGSVDVTMERLIGPELAPRAVEIFLPYFDSIMFEDLIALPGAMEILESLQANDKRLAVFTNKRGDAARATLKHLGMTPFLEKIIGANDTPWRKPQLEFTRHALDAMNGTPEQSCLVGDSPFDVESATVVGMPCHVVATGTHDQEQLGETEAKSVHANLSELARECFDLDISPNFDT